MKRSKRTWYLKKTASSDALCTLTKGFIHYTMANVLGMLGLSFYILTDTFFIAQRTGASGLAALNIALPYYNFLNGLAMMVGTGGATSFPLHRSKSIFTQSMFLLTLFAIPVFVLGVFFTEPLSIFLGANEETIKLTCTYLRTLCMFSPMFMLNALLSAFIRNDGSPGLSMAGMLSASLSNVIMDYILMYPCNLGLFGAALATGIAPIASMAIMSLHFIKKKHTFHIQKERPSLKQWNTIVSLGLFAFVTELASGISIMLFNYLIIAQKGNLGVAAYGVVANCVIVFIYIFTGISQGMQPLVSSSISLGKTKDAHLIRKYAIRCALGLSIFVYPSIYFGTDLIVNMFNSEQNIVMAAIAHDGMRLYFTSIFLSGVNIVLIAYYSAIGKGHLAFILSLLRGILFLAPVAFLMAHLFQMTGIWLSQTVTELLVLMVILFIPISMQRFCITFYTEKHVDK